nr:unnamed protein product [Callosobruchus chinensis]
MNACMDFSVLGKANISEQLDSAYLRQRIKQNEEVEVKCANFIAVESDEITDTLNHQQMVVIIRYVRHGQICERFWSFFKPDGRKADILATTLLNELQSILGASDNTKFKLIAQSYDSASVMSGKTNVVQAIIKRTYPHAHFIHCYSHQFNLIIQRAAQCNKSVKVFFANLQSFSTFFTRAPKRTAILDEVVKRRLPPAAPTRWNFKSRTVNTLFEHQDAFKECLDKIMGDDGIDSVTVSEASGLLKHLNCPDFLFWLKIFHFIMPHVEILFNQTQMRGIESAQMQKAVEQFQKQISRIRNLIDDSQEPHNAEPEGEHARKRQKLCAGDNKTVIAKEVCDTLLSQIVDRFSFKDHLSATKLFDFKNFKTYRQTFPQQYFDETVKAYSMLDSVKLKSELSALYERDDMCDVGSILPLLVFISHNNLEKVLRETYKLLDIICTTPMSTAECERCFSTLKRIKTFLRSTMTEDRLNALAVLSIEKKFVQSIPDFDNKVIEIFSTKKARRMDFMYKK